MGKNYYLHQRKNGFFYVEFVDLKSRAKLNAKNTGKTEREEARIIAELWLRDGIPEKAAKPRTVTELTDLEAILRAIRKADLTEEDIIKIHKALQSRGLTKVTVAKSTGAGAVPFIEFLKSFWDYDNSEYVRSKLTHGGSIHRSHCKGSLIKVNGVLSEFFGDKKLNEITGDDLNRLAMELHGKGLSSSTIFQTVLAAKTPLKWAFKKEMISTDPTVKIEPIKVRNGKRGILSDAEITELLKPEHWEDKRAFYASVVAVTTGMRQGEILALRPSAIEENEEGDLLVIKNSWNSTDKIKSTKNGEERKVALPPEVKAILIDLLKDNPHKSDAPFFFYAQELADSPCDSKLIRNGLKKAMDSVNKKFKEAAEKAGLEKPEMHIDYKARKICFHSWRHYFVTLGAKKAEDKKVQEVSGHLTKSVFRTYAEHYSDSDIRQVGEVMRPAFQQLLPKNILQFSKGA